MLYRLYEIRVDRILEKDCHRTFSLKILSLDDIAVKIVSDYYIAQSLLKIVLIACKAEDGHYFGCCRDGERLISLDTVRAASDTDGDRTKRSVIHIHAALPQYPVLIDTQLITLIDVVIDHGSEEVICRCYSVKVTRKVKIDVFHGKDLGIAAACSSALDTEDRT